MIDWLVGSVADHPALARGEAPPGLLSVAETVYLARLQIAKRRRDWILGRWTAKRLLQETLARTAGLNLPLDAITVVSHASGPPTVHIAPQPERDGNPSPHGDTAAGLPRVSLSISHAGDRALAAVTLLPAAAVGADIEGIAARSPAFAAEYFTPAEIARLQQAPAALYDTLVTATWSAKEAVLKSLGLGLTVDTRRVTCLLGAPASGQAQGWPDWPDWPDGRGAPRQDGAAWLPFTILLDLPAPIDLPRSPSSGGSAAGWWQITSNYALTLVLLSQGAAHAAKQRSPA